MPFLDNMNSHRELESNPAFQRVLQLIEERNLTWDAVADILDEHTILLEDVVTDD